MINTGITFAHKVKQELITSNGAKSAQLGRRCYAFDLIFNLKKSIPTI